MYIQAKSYSTMYPYYEMVGITFRETVINLFTSALVVTLVLFLLLPPGPSLTAVISVVLADVCILAWVPFTGLNLNAISSTCMVMSVGIAVDFSAHITHAFVETDGAALSGAQRAAKAVTKMGRSLTTSALTTFLSVLMLSTVTVPSNRMFFTMMTGVVIFGMLFGMLFLPSVLSFLNPSYVKPVVVQSPVTPVPQGEEADRLERTRAQGVRRHHRRHHSKKPEEKEKKPEEKEKKEEKKEKEEEKVEKKVEEKEEKPEEKKVEKVEAISDSSEDDFRDALSDSSEFTAQTGAPEIPHTPREIEMVPMTRPPHRTPIPAEEEATPRSESSPVSPKPTIKPSPSTALKKFRRPRDLEKEEEEERVAEEKAEEEEKEKEKTENTSLLDYLWSIWGSRNA